MAVKEDMDICLNITRPNESNIKQQSTPTINKDVQVKRVKKIGMVRKPFQKNQSLESSKGLVAGAKKRIKQKNLAAIVASQSAASGAPEQSILKKSSSNLNKLLKNKMVKTDGKKVSFFQGKEKEESKEPFVKFTNLTKNISGQTILAKKRKVNSDEPKKSLTNIFKLNSTDKKLKIDTSNGSETKFIKSNNDTEGSDKKESENQKNEFVELKNDTVQIEKSSDLGRRFKHSRNKMEKNKGMRNDSKEVKVYNRPGGKISSLFGNNPDVPNIGQRFVKPVNEKVFTAEKFSELGIHAYSVSNLEQNMKITTMTTVQKKSIPLILSGKDVLIRSQTGSGKTLAYALPIIETLQAIRPKLNRNCGTKALVIVPTRELALQTYECFLKLIKPFTWIVPGYLIGGEKRKAEKNRLRKGCSVLVATPGRLLDHIKHTKALSLDSIKYFVLDEADRMLDMGYEKDISQIVTALENNISTESNNYEYDALNILKQHIKSDSNSEKNNDQKSEDKILEKNDNDNAVKEVKEENKFDKKPFARNVQSVTNQGYDPLSILRQHMKSNSDNKKKQDDKMNKKSVDISNKDNNNSSNDNENSNTDSKLNTEDNSNKPKRRNTILLSATLTHAVEKLAGLTMKNPVFIDAAKDNIEAVGGNMSEINEDLIVPQSVVQSYVVTPPKLRMVTLSAFICGKCQAQGNHKIIVFMATQDMVDYHTEMLSSVLNKPMDDEDEDSDPLVDVEFHKLHGSMTQKERTDIFKAFRQAKSGVLLCTDVAARGLDLPKVDTVIQYTGPTSTRDYVHRIGRTARAGSSGSAIIFLTPPEVQFVRMLESRKIRIGQDDMDDILSNLLLPLSKHNSVQYAAIALQNDFENLVLENKQFYSMACKAYTSWVRFYSSYPREMREVFNRKDLHLGHYAKSFALRDPPQKIGGIGKNIREKEESRLAKPKHQNRLSNQRAEEREKGRNPGQQQNQNSKNQQDKRNSMLKKVHMLNVSEYGSGLEPIKKHKKS